MNLLLLERHEIGDDGIAVLGDRRAEHLRKVLKVEAGQELRAGVVGERDRGPLGSAEVVEVGNARVTVRFEAESGTESESESETPVRTDPEVDVVVGMPRPQVLHRVLQTVASMSVRRLDLVAAWRVEKSYFHTPSLHADKIRRQLLLGAEQGMTTRLPDVRQQRLLVPFLRSLGDGGDGPLRLIAHPDGEVDLEQAIHDPERPVQLAIGPEGGWVDREVETFRESGFRPVRLGPWVLRVEVALAVALGQLAAARRVARAARGC